MKQESSLDGTGILKRGRRTSWKVEEEKLSRDENHAPKQAERFGLIRNEEPASIVRAQCGVAYHSQRTVQTLDDLVLLTVVVRSCCTETCERYRVFTHPEEEGRWVLPLGEIGLDVIALVGSVTLRERHRSIPEIHQHVQARGVRICESTVLHLVHR